MRTLTNRVLPAFAALMIAVATLVVITRGQHHQEREPSNVGVTSVKEGVMTETQRRHSKLYENRRNRKLRDLPGPVELVVSTPWDTSREENIPRTLDEFLRVAACSADVVVVGTVRNNSSQLTDDGTFIFTDSDLTVENILKNNGANIQLHDNIILTRPGGAVELNGKVLRVKDKSFKPLKIDHSYLVLLRFIPATGAYQQLNSQSAFELNANRIRPLTEEAFSFSFVGDHISPQMLEDRVRAAVSSCTIGR